MSLPVGVESENDIRVKVKAINRKRERQSYPLIIQPTGSALYFQARDSFSIWGLVGNPLGILAICGVFMVVIFPKVIGNLGMLANNKYVCIHFRFILHDRRTHADPAELDQLAKQQADMNPFKMLNNLKQSLEENPEKSIPRISNQRVPSVKRK